MVRVSPISFTSPSITAPTPQARRRSNFARQLMQEASRTTPILSDWQGINQVAKGIIGALIEKNQQKQTSERREKISETLSQAMKASQPWIPPEDVYAQSDILSGPRAALTVRPGAEPVAMAGQPAPGTGGVQPMIDILAQTPETSNLAMQMRMGQIQSSQSLQDRITAAKAARAGTTYQVHEGDETVTYKHTPDGSAVELGRSSRWQPRASNDPRDGQIRTFNRGDQEITEQYDATSKSWIEHATGSRWKTGDNKKPQEGDLRDYNSDGKEITQQFTGGKWINFAESPLWKPESKKLPQDGQIRQFERDDQKITEQYDAESNSWIEHATADRFKPESKKSTKIISLREGDNIVNYSFNPNDDSMTKISEAPRASADPVDKVRARVLESMSKDEQKQWMLKPRIAVDFGDKEFAKVIGRRLDRMHKRVDDNEAIVPRLETIALGLESGTAESGPIEQLILPVRQISEDLGLNIDENLPQQEQVAAAMKFMVPRMRVTGSGSTSNFEMREFRKAAPNMWNTEEGNIILSRSMLQVHERNRRAADLADKFFMDNGNLHGFNDHADEILGPVFPRPKNANDYKEMISNGQLRPGVVYFHPELNRFAVYRGG